MLVIDDQEDARAMMKKMLHEIGITQIFEAANGRDGLKFLDMSPDMIDIVLCDWNMPSMTGVDLLRQLRSAEPNFPFLMVTGRRDLGSVAQAKGAGVTGYILKPFSITQLEAKMRIISQSIGMA